MLSEHAGTLFVFFAIFLLVIALFFSYRKLVILLHPYMDSPTDKAKILKKLPTPLCCAHRGGGSSFGPENTFYTYKKSAETANIDLLEIDIQITQDNVFVLSHDSLIDRTTNGSGRIYDYTYGELCQIDAAYWFSTDNGKTYPLRNKGLQIPRLTDVLDYFLDEGNNNEKYKNLIFYFDLKDIDGKIPDLLDLISTDYPELYNSPRLILGSVFHSINNELRQHKPSWIPATPSISRAGLAILLHKLHLINFLPLNCEIMGIPYGTYKFPVLFESPRKFVSKEFVDWSHSRGRKVFVFGHDMDDSEYIMDALRMGVDGIFSDRPDKLSKCIQKYKIEKLRGEKIKLNESEQEIELLQDDYEIDITMGEVERPFVDYPVIAISDLLKEGWARLKIKWYGHALETEMYPINNTIHDPDAVEDLDG